MAEKKICPVCGSILIHSATTLYCPIGFRDHYSEQITDEDDSINWPKSDEIGGLKHPTPWA